MKKIKIAAGFLILAILALTVDSFAGRGLINDLENFYPPVELQYPVTQDIDLTGKTSLQFRWRRTDQAQTDHYEFKLYKGYERSESTLILKQDITGDEYPFELPAANFEVGQVYTWSLRQVYLDNVKGDRSYSPFKIIKK